MFKENELGNRYCPFIQGMCNLKCVFIKKTIKGDTTNLASYGHYDYEYEYECIMEKYFRKNIEDNE